MRNAIILLLLFSIASASCIENATDIVFEEQGGNIMLVIGLTIMLIAIAYVVGSFFRNLNYIVFAKDELYHLGFSVVLLAAFSGILLFSCSVMDMFYASAFENLGSMPSGCYMEGAGTNSVASCYVNMIKRDATRLSEHHINSYLSYLMDSTFSYTITLPLINAYTVTGGAYKRVISNQYDLILNMFLVPALMSISMQKLALDFINANVIRWILPIAFLLRIFIPTRHMGNILIAISVGLYVVVPFMYVFNLSMYEAVMPECSNFARAVCDNVIDSYACSGGAYATPVCTNPYGFWNIARLIPQAVFLPNLTIAILITFFGAVHKALRVVG